MHGGHRGGIASEWSHAVQFRLTPSLSFLITIRITMILDALHRIANHGQSLLRAEAREVMSEVLAGKCSDAQIAALLVALRMKGETVEEIVGFAEAIRSGSSCSLPIERVSSTGILTEPSSNRRRRGSRHCSEWHGPRRTRRRISAGVVGRHQRNRRRRQRYLQHFHGDSSGRGRSGRARG